MPNNSEAKRRREYRNLNRANLLPLRILNFLSKSPEEEFIRSEIQKATYDAWDRQEQALKLLVDIGCIEEKDKTKAIVKILIVGKFNAPKGIEYLSKALDHVLMYKETAKIAIKLYLMKLDELPKKVRNLIIAHEKAEIENRFIISQPTKDWVEVWSKNIANYETLVLYAVCQNQKCKTRNYPVLMPYRTYRERMATDSRTIDYNDGFSSLRHLTGDCQNCQTKDGIFVLNSYENVRRCVNQILKKEISNKSDHK